GGKYSPQGARPAQGANGQGNIPPRAPAEVPVRVTGKWRANVLFLSAFAFLFPAFGDAPDAMLMGLCAGGLLIFAALLSREGLRARAEYEARRVARRPAIPRLLFGAVVTGAALALGGVIAHGFSLIPLFYALA